MLGTRLLLIVVLAAAPGWLACAGPQRPFSEWYYSSWYQSEGTGSKGGFEKTRAACLEEAGIIDPAAAQPGSPSDDRYLACMNRGHWCTQAYHCQKVGVH